MRAFSSAIQNYLNDGRAIVAHQLVYFWAVNRTTQLTETIGFWTGIEDVTLTVDGQSRSYIGRGVFQGTEPIVRASGLDVRRLQMQIAAPSAEAEDLVKGYNLRFAPAQVHTAFFDAETRALVDAPVRDFKGVIDQVEFPTVAPGEMSYAQIELVSETRALTRVLAGKKSHQTHKANGGDGFRKYGDVSGSIPTPWGELRAAAPSSQPPAPPSRPSQGASAPDTYPKGP